MKCKVFNSSRDNLESEVNEWLKLNDNLIEIQLSTQTFENGSENVTLVIFYSKQT